MRHANILGPFNESFWFDDGFLHGIYVNLWMAAREHLGAEAVPGGPRVQCDMQLLPDQTWGAR